MSDAPYELSLAVCSMIPVVPDEDRAAYEDYVESVSTVQDALREQGVDVDLLSQPGAELWEGGIETVGALYQLARLVCHLERGQAIDEVIADGPVLSDDLDPLVTDVWDELFNTAYPHLINLQGELSYYLPVEFDTPIWLPFESDDGEEEQAFFASSYRLQRELAEIAPQLTAAGVNPHSAAFRCLEALTEAAEASITFGMPIIVY